MDESPRRRRWSQAARRARERAVQAAQDYRSILGSALTSARAIEAEARDNPLLITRLVEHIRRDLLLVRVALADILALMEEPRPDPLCNDERRVGWPSDIVLLCRHLAILAQQHEDVLARMLEILSAIDSIAHDDPDLVTVLAVRLQIGISQVEAALIIIRRDLLRVG